MKETQYKKFSLNVHEKNSRFGRPNVCQFELTFGCGLNCKHCYTSCYNKPEYIRKELKFKQVKTILDKLYYAGVIWICFTGGDPLSRKDFLNIYNYAKDKGFIVTIFTNGYSMNKRIAKRLKANPPFVIEITLNTVNKGTYEKISREKGSFIKTMQGINLILSSKIPLKIKTQVTRDNLKDFSKTKEFIKSLGLRFRPSFDLFPRLNGDLFPCSLRLSPEEIFILRGGKKYIPEEECFKASSPTAIKSRPQSLFRCAIGSGDGLHVDPYGNTFPCNLIRLPEFNLLKFGIKEAMNKSLSLVQNRQFKTASKCKGCHFLYYCRLCPGKAYLETRDMESPVGHYCELTQIFSS